MRCCTSAEKDSCCEKLIRLSSWVPHIHLTPSETMTALMILDEAKAELIAGGRRDKTVRVRANQDNYSESTVRSNLRGRGDSVQTAASTNEVDQSNSIEIKL